MRQGDLLMLGVWVTVVMVAVFGLLAMGAGAGAAAGGNNSTAANATAETTERIDANTQLVDARFHPDTGKAWVTIRSDILQEITVTDAGAFMEGGEIARRSVTVRPGEETTISIPATKYRNFVGVSIATRETLFAVPIEIPTSWFEGDPTWDTVKIAGAGAVVGVLLALIGEAWRRRTGGRSEVEQIA